MSAAAALPAPIDERRRLTATLVISLLLHGVLILGVGFAVSEDAPLVPTLDVIFSQTSTPLTPRQADFLAQANQQGGGNHATAQRPRDSQPGGAAGPQRAGTAGAACDHAAGAGTDPDPRGGQPPRRAGRAHPATESADRPALAHRCATRAARRGNGPARRRGASAFEQYAKRPNRKFVSASTREYAYANYLRAWVDRAERVGNLNYPDEARRRRLGGKVVISVGVRRDGSVESSRVLVSSGTPALDAAALRVVQLAQPFPPLPRTKDDVDILQVTRTWLFLPGGELHDDR